MGSISQTRVHTSIIRIDDELKAQNVKFNKTNNQRYLRVLQYLHQTESLFVCNPFVLKR